MIKPLATLSVLLAIGWIAPVQAQITDICKKEIARYAQEKLGSEATDIAFDFASGEGDTDAVAYFSTADCPDGQYQVKFNASEQLCGETYYGSHLPQYVGELLVVPQGCPSAAE